MTVEELNEAKKDSQKVVLSQLGLSMTYKSILASLLGSILIAQIIAHAPLTDIYLPANLL